MNSSSPPPAQKWVDSNTTLFWFRRDLRLDDNCGLLHALKENKQVLPVFIFDETILGKLEDPSDARVTFIHQCLQRMHEDLEKKGSSLLVLKGKPETIFASLHPKAVYANHDYEPYARQRDAAVKDILDKKGIPFHTFKDQVIFEKEEVVKDDGKPYTVFTPYSRKWKSIMQASSTEPYATSSSLNNLQKTDPIPLPSLAAIGFHPSVIGFPERVIRTAIIKKYTEQRDFPGIESTTRLSVHLRFGTLSIRSLVKLAMKTNETWLNELIWREFYQMILWHFPYVVDRAFKPAYDQIEWRNNPQEFQQWCDGKTGYPIVDAGMRELNGTGFMHNRVRMIVASFLTKHLLIDWRWGEAYFAKKLLDFDLAANNGGWQWAAGSGCDAAPYFRVFNPYLQTEKFDPDRTYIRKWVPEFDTATYPQPIVDHDVARKRVLAAYKVALEA